MITGGAGFVGSHLAELFLSQGDQVTVIDDLSTGCLDNIQPLIDHPNFDYAIATIENEIVVDRVASQCDLIVHLAAVVGVQRVLDAPAETITTNIGGTEAVMRVARRYGIKTLIASTSEVYGKGVRVPFGEEDDVVLGATSRGRWVYAASKMVDEFLGLAYHSQYGLPVILFRLFNTVGPRQTGSYGMVMPRFVHAALTGEPLQVYGDGRQSRCFCHVLDAVQAIGALAEHPDAVGRVFNIGSTSEISILSLAQRVIEVLESPSPVEMVPYEEAYAEGFEDMRRRVPDISRIRALTRWSPQRSLDDIILDIAQSMQ